MKKSNLLYWIACILFLYGCSSSNENVQNTARGTLISQMEKGSYPKDQIKLAFSFLSASAAQSITPLYDIKLYKVLYYTTDANGKAVQASGLVAVPQNVTKALPLVSFHHGTVLRKTDVPSQLGTGFQIGLAFGTEGYIVAMPDFLGLGESPVLHPYMHAKTEATACVDMLRATQALCKQLNISWNNQLFLMGYSQGGHVTLAVHKEIEEKHRTEFNITASAPMAAPTDLSGLQMDSLIAGRPYVAPSYLPYVMFALNPIYKMYPDLSAVLNPPYNTTLQPYFTVDMPFSTSQLESILPPSKIPTDIMKAEELQKIRSNRATHPTTLALKDNDVYDWKPSAPLKFYHCDADRHVFYANAVKAKQSFEKNGSATIDIINPLQGGNHETCLVPSIIGAKDWFATLKK